MVFVGILVLSGGFGWLLVIFVVVLGWFLVVLAGFDRFGWFLMIFVVVLW